MTPCGCRIEFVPDPPQGHPDYEGDGDDQIIFCPLHQAAEIYKEVCNQILDETDLPTLQRLARFAIDRENALAKAEGKTVGEV